jgi:hypothetical protein
MFRLSVHTFANITDICKDTLLVAFAVNGWGCNSVSLPGGSKEGRVRGVEGGIKPSEELRVGIVSITSKPGLGTLVYASWCFTAIENIIPKLSLIDVIEMLSVRNVLVLVSVGVLALRFLQLLLESFQVEGCLFLGRLFLLFQIGKVEILRNTGCCSRGICYRG